MTVPARAPSPGWETVDYPHGTLLIARRACLEADRAVRRALLRLLRGDRPRAAGPAGGLGGRARPRRRWSTTRRCARAARSPTTSCTATRCCWCASTRVATTRSSASASPCIQLVRGLVQPSYDPWIFSATGTGAGDGRLPARPLRPPAAGDARRGRRAAGGARHTRPDRPVGSSHARRGSRGGDGRGGTPWPRSTAPATIASRAVRDALAAELRRSTATSARRVAVMLDGELVVDIWGGFTDEARTDRPGSATPSSTSGRPPRR